VSKTVDVNPVVDALLGRLGGAELVGTAQAVSIIREGRASSIDSTVDTVAVDNEHREARGDFFNDGHLPVSEDGVGDAVPTAAKGFTLAKGKVVNDAGTEVVVEIDLREGPIQLLPVRERIVGGAKSGTQAVAEANVVGTGISITDQSVDAVARALSFGFDLKPVVMGHALVGDVGDGVEREIGGVRGSHSSSARPAANGVAGNVSACHGGGNVEVIAIDENVVTAGTCISGCEHDITRQLTLDVDVELLHGA